MTNEENIMFQQWIDMNGGKEGSLVEIKRIICQKKKKNNTQVMAITAAVDHAKTKKQEEKQSLFLEHRRK